MITHPAGWDGFPASPTIAPRVKVTAYLGAATVDVPVTDGELVKDATRYPRTMVTVQTADTSLVPHALADVLQPFGSRLKVEYGYADSAGTVTYIQVADGPIVQTTAHRPGGVIQLESWDDSFIVASDLSPSDQPFGAGTDHANQLVIDTVNNSMNGYFPTVVNTLSTAQKAVLVPVDWSWIGDPWAAVLELGTMCGADVYFDSARQLILRPAPVVAAPVFTFQTGPAGTVTSYESTQRPPFNSVWAPFDHPAGTPYTMGLWQDPSPITGTSSAYMWSNVYVATVQTGTPTAAVANGVAANIARRVRRSRTVRLEAVPVPWLEPGDTVAVQTIGGPWETHLVSGFTLPLGLRPMSLTTQDPTYTGPM